MGKRNSGNVLFLILIAVALFAALSYVVTQSNRGGGSSTENEKIKLDIAQISQLITSLNLGVLKLSTHGVRYDDMVFYADGVDSCTPNYKLCSTGDRCVFSQTGGGAVISKLPPRIFKAISIGFSLPGGSNFDNATNFWLDCRDIMSDWGMGTAAFERAFYINNVTPNICRAYNKVNAGVDAIIPVSSLGDELTACVDQSGQLNIFTVLFVQ